jgi:hypothetical protein
MDSRVDQWIEQNRPERSHFAECTCGGMRWGSPVYTCDGCKQFAAASAQYCLKISLSMKAHGVTVRDLPEGLSFVDGAPSYRKFEVRQKEDK